MEFISTRSQELRTTAAGAILRGLAEDGGLYVPASLPRFSLEEIKTLKDMSYPALAAAVLERFLPGFTAEELNEYTRKAYASFDTPAVVPLRPLRDGVWSLELHHGPTCAFKDLALQILPYLLAASGKKCADGHTIAILVATSGDTGKAALCGFADVPGTKIAVFYPHGGVSDIQRAQMVTQEGDNVLVLAVEGNFDDAQTGVKKIFSDKALEKELDAAGVALSSANSINWGRLAPQIAYYYGAYTQLLNAGKIALGDTVDFCVPTGNFGDILAGYFAKKSGLPVDKLICASNSNNVLTDFLRTGVYDRNRPFLKTMSPSMDILVSSNLERLLYLVTEDTDQVAEWMAALRETGRYDIGEKWLEVLRQEGFEAYFADEEETAREIRAMWTQQGYLADPHTAVALSAAEQYRQESRETRPLIALSTASPFKFAASMLSSLGESVPESGFDAQEALSALSGQRVPAPLAELRQKPERFPGVTTPADMREDVRRWLA
ncbi:MAG: threonine synthase [Oscillospiraceae bacterium]|nr:threonine synthase [Oscillospiraceae bacterium]